MKKIIVILLVIISSVIGYNYIYQDHRDIESETADFTVTSQSIHLEFAASVTEAETKYLNKTVEILGTISELNQKDLTLDDKIFCQFSTPINASIKLSSQYKIKGRVIGYDDLLEQVKLDQTTILN